ncbi:hypothetical protein ACP4OV_030556 [Aristida adscensionis]
MACGLWPGDAVLLALYIVLVIVVFVTMIRFYCEQPPADADGAAQPRVPVSPETAASPAAEVAPAAAAAAAALPCFPYAAGGRVRAAEAAVCAICLEPLRRGQLCAEVPACRHAFHRDCVGAWAKSRNTCPLCRARIVPVPGPGGATMTA